MPPVNPLIRVQASGNRLGLVGDIVETDAVTNPMPISPSGRFSIPDIAERLNDGDRVAGAIAHITHSRARVQPEKFARGRALGGPIWTGARNTRGAEVIVREGASIAIRPAVVPNLIFGRTSWIRTDRSVGRAMKCRQLARYDGIISILRGSRQRLGTPDIVARGLARIKEIEESVLFDVGQ